MREILFRGKRTDNGEWVYGNYYHCCGTAYGATFIVVNDFGFIEVIPHTVGQYTGLTDMNGKKIFEGDLMAFRPLKCVVEVVWDGIGWKTFSRFLGGKIRLADATERYDIHTMRTFEVVGNKWDNPELLEVKK